MYIKKGKEKAETGSRYEKGCLGGGVFKPFQKEKSWNEDVKFHFHSFSSYSSLQLHVLHKNSIRTRIQLRGSLRLKVFQMNFKFSKYLKYNWKYSTPWESIQNWSFRYPPRDGICIFISLSPPLLAVGKAEFTAYAAEIMLNLSKLHVYNKVNNNCL